MYFKYSRLSWDSSSQSSVANVLKTPTKPVVSKERLLNSAKQPLQASELKKNTSISDSEVPQPHSNLLDDLFQPAAPVNTRQQVTVSF